MKRLLINVSIIIFMKVSVIAQVKKIEWVEETKKAAWQGRDSQGEFVYDNHLWILGGWDTPETPNFLDAWKSPDGKSWTRATEKAPWVQSDLPVSLVFKNKMWIMGGRKVPGTECSNKVWSSTNGSSWNLVTSAAGWSPRLGAGYAVFKNRMWVLGGTNDFYHQNDTTLMNDIWSSADGKNWKLEVANAPWSKRAYLQAVVFNNKIWVMGGGKRQPVAVPTNDVWCSEDGIHWTEITPAAEWKPRLWFSSILYRNRMWVLGGWSPETYNFGDVWYSKDGKIWTEFKSDVQWSKRHELSAWVFLDKIWVAGGAAEPNYELNSEVWSLKIPKDWFEKNK
ncbi:MAG: Kelch repeat-containing protein [Ginsengibacter sp.]